MKQLKPSRAVFAAGVCSLLLLGTAACSDDSPPNDPAPSDGGEDSSASGTGGSEAGGGSGGTGGGSSGSGGSKAGGGGKNNGGGAGKANPGGSSNGGSGGSGPVLGDWSDVSPPDSNGNCSGVVVNRLTGDVFVDVTNQGIWKSTDQGGQWANVDGGVVGGLIVLGPGFDVDQENPERMAAWSLDGDGGWTNDGTTWKKIANLGRNWDFGATDWASADPKTMIVTRHEADGEVYLSTDGALSWDLLSIKVYASKGTVPPPEFAMVGVMDAQTLIYSDGDGSGIFRSTNSGASFTKVSEFNARTRVPVLFKDVFYLGGDGLIISKDKGATWEQQGSAIEMWVGPYFGADETQMMMANNEGVYLTDDAGETWNKVASIPPDFKYDPQVWGSFAWDPINNVLYAAAVEKPLLKLTL